MSSLVVTELVPGPVVHFPGRARRGEEQGGRTVEAKLDLDASDYDTGGYLINPDQFGLSQVYMIDQMATGDPWGTLVGGIGVSLVFDRSDTASPKLLVYDEAAQVANNWVPAGVTDCWVRLYGR
jgi:hypothetical protein